MVMSAGPIKDRTQETLAPADAAVMRYYRMMLQMAKSVAAGGSPIRASTPIPVAYRAVTQPSRTGWIHGLVPGTSV